MKVVIVGAGLGGLACAITCRQQNIDVVVLERSPEVGEVGAGIQIPPNGIRIVKELNLLPQLLAKGSVVQHIDFRRYDDGRLIRSMPFGEDIVQEFGVPWVIIHRVDYHRVLLDEAVRLGAEIRLNASVEGVFPDESEVLLEGGERVRGDVIIGADGLWSRVRETVLDSPITPEETGDLAYRATFRKEQLGALNDERVNELCSKIAVTTWLGPDKHTIFYPVRGGEEFNLVLLRPDNLEKGVRRVEGDVEEMRQAYPDWDETLRKLISCIPSVYKWKLTHLPELHTWTRGPVALLGDACHPTLPYQAQGAAMAVEDGFAIGRLLGLLNMHFSEDRHTGDDPTLSTRQVSQSAIPAVLCLYEKIRKARTTRSVRGAVMNRRIFHLEDGVLQTLRDIFIRNAGVTRGTDWTWYFSFRMRQMLDHDLAGECAAAFREYVASVKSG